ncbi:MAG: hypothetical protein ICV85_01000 [Tolypothrix sp. T3-bin4]|nr:hypothetical protein [Tolypothrix sp. T3-bin4]
MGDRTYDSGVMSAIALLPMSQISDRTLSNCVKSAMSGDKKQSFYALLVMELM